MAKPTRPNNPHAAAIFNEMRTIQEITGEQLGAIFRWFVAISDHTLRSVAIGDLDGGDEFRRLASKGDKAIEAATRALGVVFLAAREGYEDILGQAFEACWASSDRLGQFFTPWPVSQLMARMSVLDLEPKADGSPIRVLDPACGSGGMLLACAEAVAETRPELAGSIEYYGADIDIACVHMTRLNLFAHGLRGGASHEDAITGEVLSTPPEPSPLAAAFEALRRADAAIERLQQEAEPEPSQPAVDLDTPMPLLALCGEPEEAA